MVFQFRRLTLGLLIALLGIVASLLPVGASLEENVGLYWLFHLRGAAKIPSDVVVVAIDQQSAQKLGLPNKPKDWPRTLHADLVQRLVSAGAEAIVFDLTFDTPSKVAAYDHKFSEAIAAAQKVLLVATLKKTTIPVTSVSGAIIGSASTETLVPPISVLDRAALAHAPFPLPRASRVNAYWTFKTITEDTPTLPVAAFQIYALQAYDEFLSLWRKAAPFASKDLPSNREAVFASKDIPNLVITFRNALLKDPQIAERMQQELKKLSDQDVEPRKKQIIRSLLRVYRGNDEEYLNYYGPPWTITTVPYYRALQDDRASDFKGKVVFVGFSASSQPEQDRIRDDYHTVFSQPSGLDISGVEIAATAFGNLLEDQAITRIGGAWQLGLMTLWGLVLGTVCRAFRPALAGLIVAILSLIYLYAAVRLFDVADLWIPLLLPLVLQSPLALFGGALMNYRDARREREAIKRTFGYFLPNLVVDQLAKSVGPVTSTNQLIYGACLATDAEHYTTLAEKMDPIELGRLMNDYYAELFKPVEQRGGIVSDVIGDAMLAIWASSSSDVSVRGQACQATLDLARAIEAFNQVEAGRPALHTRIGLHFGQMMLGSVGAVHHYEYRAVGDIVNTATRIQSLNKYLGTRLLISAEAAEGLDDFLTRPLGSFLLAGKSTPVKVFELLGHRQDPHRGQVQLCRKFARALEAYCAQQWREAADEFSEILTGFDNDGPSLFYLRLCERFAANPPAGAWEPTIRVDGK